MDSDIPSPYGRTVALKKEERTKSFDFEKWNKGKRQDVLLVHLNSHCSARNNRNMYMKILHKYITIDRYGKCARDM